MQNRKCRTPSGFCLLSSSFCLGKKPVGLGSLSHGIINQRTKLRRSDRVPVRQDFDNSPAIHGWVKRLTHSQSPGWDERKCAEGSAVPAGTRFWFARRNPELKLWAIFKIQTGFNHSAQGCAAAAIWGCHTYFLDDRVIIPKLFRR